jgi:hypothetical protein
LASSELPRLNLLNVVHKDIKTGIMTGKKSGMYTAYLKQIMNKRKDRKNLLLLVIREVKQRQQRRIAERGFGVAERHLRVLYGTLDVAFLQQIFSQIRVLHRDLDLERHVVAYHDTVDLRQQLRQRL